MSATTMPFFEDAHRLILRLDPQMGRSNLRGELDADDGPDFGQFPGFRKLRTHREPVHIFLVVDDGQFRRFDALRSLPEATRVAEVIVRVGI